MRLKLAALLLLVAIGSGSAGYVVLGAGSTSSATGDFLTATVTRQDVVDEVTATGSLAASATYQLAFGAAPSPGDVAPSTSDASISWPVRSVEVGVGDLVTANEVLATAGTADLDAAITDAKRAVWVAELQLTIADETLDDADTTATRRQARIGRYQAQTQLADAHRQLDDLTAMRAWAVLESPVDGIVTAVSISDGADAPSGAAITVAASDLQVVGQVVEADLPRVSVGQAATVTITALDGQVSGTVSAIAPSAAASNGGSVVTYDVTVTLSDPPAAARAGMSAEVSITVAESANALAVPVAALDGSAGSHSVRVLGADGTVEVRSVAAGLITSDMAEITSGLQEGETVITGTSSQQNSTTGAGGGGAGVFLPGGGGGPVTRTGP